MSLVGVLSAEELTNRQELNSDTGGAAGLRMEETLQQEKPESEYKNETEDQGGIRRRLRDRDLLKKRKAEAEAKETNQLESQRKRPRAEQKGGSRKRGRPRKSEVTPEIPFLQEETAPAQEGPAVVVVPEPVEVIPAQASGSLIPLLAVGSDMFESPPAPVIAAPAPVIAAPAPVIAAPAPMLFGSLQSPLFAPTLISRAPLNPTPAFVSPSVLAPAKVLDTASVPAQDSSPAPDAVPVPAVSRDPVPAVAQVETLYTESQDRVALNQVLIEDLGPDDEDDIPPTQDKGADEDLSETPLINVSEQSKMLTIPLYSSLPPPQDYLSGN